MQRWARNAATLLGLVAVVLVGVTLHEAPAAAGPEPFPAFEADYGAPSGDGTRIERLEYRARNDWRLTTLSDGADLGAVGGYEAAEAGKHVSFAARFDYKQTSSISPGTTAVPGPWFRPATGHIGITADRLLGAERLVEVTRSIDCGAPGCASGRRTVTWTEEYTYDAASGVPLGVRTIDENGNATELRRAIRFELK